MAFDVASDTSTRRLGAKPDINITPLVDVVLVLLIIFMVVTPQMEAGASVALPAILNPDKGNAPVDPTTVTLTRDGKLYFEKEAIAREALVAKLEQVHLKHPENRVIIKADLGVEYGKVRNMFKTCQEIGFPGASLQVIDRANKKE
jgi:biopolymer transport protein TolR